MPANTKHLYSVVPTSKPLGQHCMNVIQMFCVWWDAQFIKSFNFANVYFSQVKNIFHHLKLEIASAIPASNE